MNNKKETDTWNPEEYARFSKGQKILAEELIAKMNIQPNDSILDIGCGDGKITALLAGYTRGSVTGIDKDPGMIALASKRYPKVDFQTMDAEKITFNNACSIVFSNAALHWAHDHRSILDGIYRTLKPGGKMLLQFGGHGNVEDAVDVMESLIREEKYRDYFRDFVFPWFFPEQKSYEILLDGSNFAEADVHMIPKKMIHDTVADFQGWLRTTSFPYIHRLPENMRAEFVNAITEKYLQKIPMDSQGKIHVGMMRIEVSAKK